ncbi:MAG: DUF4304 domain-containing protein [Rubricoccaceae bacterium]|nr:DUF4304 domain-containing protein [Rubricoccaceae bacterium]
MPAKDAFLALLRDDWIPELRGFGFKGSGRRLYRNLGEVVHSVAVRTDKYGTRCCVELGVHPTFLPLTSGSPPAGAADVEPEASEFRRTLAAPGQPDDSWALDEGRSAAQRLAETFRAQGEPEFQRVRALRDLAALITLEDLRRGWPVSPWYPYTPTRAALTMARIHRQLGDQEASRAFAEAGLGLDDPRGLKEELGALARAA